MNAELSRIGPASAPTDRVRYAGAMRASIWTAAGGTPRKLGELPAGPLPPHLEALVPPRHTGNIQRQLQQALFARLGIELRGRPLAEQDLLSLVYWGRGGIGALDVHPDDAAAEAYYCAPPLVHTPADLPAILRYVRGRASAEDVEQVLAVPVAGVPGMQPKILLDAWLAKLTPTAFPGLLPLEALAYEVHRQAGCVVPDTHLAEIEGEELLLSRRFDRDGMGIPVPLESVYAMLATRAPGRVRCNTDASQEEVFELLGELQKLPQGEAFRRFALALLTGNGDVHLENTSVLGTGSDAKLCPVYDPAPMRAYRGRPSYDLLCALPFGGVGGVKPAVGMRPYADSGATPPDLLDRLIAVGAAAGLDEQQAWIEIDRSLAATEDFIESAVKVLQGAVPVGYVGRAPDIQGFAATLREIRARLL